MALFQQSSGASGTASKNFLEFKCGKMNKVGTTVTADVRKGENTREKNPYLDSRRVRMHTEQNLKLLIKK